MSSVFKPNNAALRKMERELQRSFNKFNITVPVRIEQPEIPHDWVADTSLAANSTIINAGDNSQITVNSQNVQQPQTIVSELDSFGDLRMVMQEILCKLSDLELTDEDSQELKESAEEVIAELDSDTPDTGKNSRLRSSDKAYIDTNCNGCDCWRGDRYRGTCPTVDRNVDSSLLGIFSWILNKR